MNKSILYHLSLIILLGLSMILSLPRLDRGLLNGFAYLHIYILPKANAQAALSTPTPTLTPLPTPQAKDKSVDVVATVGDYILTVSGSIAPFASVELIGGDTPLKSTIADSNGNFTIVLKVAKGFSQFCLDAIDIKRYGESYSCYSISPVNADFSDINLYLPPTVGIDRKELTAGQSIIVRGYGLPGSSSIIHLSDGRILYINTDQTGYYYIQIPIKTEGSYSLFANASLKGKLSVAPQKKLSFLAISSWENLRRFIVRLFTPPLLYIWILLLLLLIVSIRFMLKKYSSFRHALRRSLADKPGNRNLLHHAWFVGY